MKFPTVRSCGQLNRFLGLTIVGWLLTHAACGQIPPPAPVAHTFRIGADDFLLDGQPYVIRCGEMHFPRVPRAYWSHRLQMAKAMGLNTICVYLFWNYHEWEEGKFNWQGQADAAEFCRLAQKEGLWVILRPGPYSCAEWEMGGLPWWLLKRDGIQLRTQDPKFMEPAQRYLREVGRVLAPLQITHGGPILMAQVENEYGGFAKNAADTGYMGAMRQAMLDAGFDVPLFACNPRGSVRYGFRDDLFQVVNFGDGPEQAFDELRKFQKTGPLMNGEFYPGWFDSWGSPHHLGNTEQCLNDLKYMLDHRCSFSIYMAHGGTSFGLWAGANSTYRPQTSSYDYDAPISEPGWATEKFSRIRELFSKYRQPGETIPEPPARNPVITVPVFQLLPFARAEDQGNGPGPNQEAAKAGAPGTMESFGQARGCIMYIKSLPPGPAGKLTVEDTHDYGWVSLDGKPLGVLDRGVRRNSVMIPARKEAAQLSIFVEAGGRINISPETMDYKGIIGEVHFTPSDGGPTIGLQGWDHVCIPLEEEDFARISHQTSAEESGHGQTVTVKGRERLFWRGHFDVAVPGDTFLDLRSWGHGVVWVNGRCLGRFWNIGPTQTMYLPGPWLKVGANEVIVLDLLAPRQPALAGLAQPVLDELHPELNWNTHMRAKGTFTAEGLTPATQGSFTSEATYQDAKFPVSTKGRYLCLESLNTHDSANVTAVAELDAFGPDGRDLPKSNWKILWVSSEESSAEDGSAENAINGQSADFWHTAYSGGRTPFPHRLVIDLGEETVLGGLRYLPRQGGPDKPGRIKDYRVYVSHEPFGLTAAP